MSSNPKTLLTEEEYLAIERQAEFRSEYFAGEMFAMVGASLRHNRIVTNLVARLDEQLREGPCNVYSTDLRVKVQNTGLYTYPDVVVTCGEAKLADAWNDTLLNPLVIIEVLSDSTEAYDRGKKFENYQSIESLREYLLVSQHSRRIEQFVRQPGKSWLYSEAHEPGEVVRIQSVECELRLEEIYRKVE
ncbi:MAG TPA: Uma2 family endonuclease [Pyrinomonadaceae bacterium]|nr:Uma2 family endonuclease [Pyrinomonadaceae bacterium]